MKYLIPILFLFSSCRTVNKLFHKEKTSIDSTVVTHNVSIEEKHIDTTKKAEVKQVKKNSVVVDLKTDSLQSIGEYFVTYDSKTHTIKSNQPITNATFKGSKENEYSNFQGGIDSSILKSETTDSAHLKKDVTVISKSVTKKVSFSTVIYWGIGILIFLLLLYIIYRYRNQIKSFVLKATTGL